MSTTISHTFSLDQFEGNTRRRLFRGSSGHSFDKVGKTEIPVGNTPANFTCQGQLYLYADNYVNIDIEFFDPVSLDSTGSTRIEEFRGMLVMPGTMEITVEKHESTLLDEVTLTVVMSLP